LRISRFTEAYFRWVARDQPKDEEDHERREQQYWR